MIKQCKRGKNKKKHIQHFYRIESKIHVAQKWRKKKTIDSKSTCLFCNISYVKMLQCVSIFNLTNWNYWYNRSQKNNCIALKRKKVRFRFCFQFEIIENSVEIKKHKSFICFFVLVPYFLHYFLLEFSGVRTISIWISLLSR